MARKSIVVQLPNNLKDPRQPSSLNDGEETLVGQSKVIPVNFSMDIWSRMNYGGSPISPINDITLFEDTADLIVQNSKIDPIREGKRIMDRSNSYLNRFVNLGYQISRSQWYTVYDTFQVTKGDSKEETITKQFGTSVSQAHNTSRTLGVTVGTTNTTKVGAKASVSASYGSISGSAEVSAEYQQTNSKVFKEDLSMGQSSSQTNDQQYSIIDTNTYLGGDSGGRYVFFQIIDRFSVKRIDTKTMEPIEVNNDEGIISDVLVQGGIFEMFYPY
jgi:hypothetical protein